MDHSDRQNKANKPDLSWDDDLELLEAMYRAAQRGLVPPLSKEQHEVLHASGRLHPKEAIPLEPSKINHTAKVMVNLLWMQIETAMITEYGKEKWQTMDQALKNWRIWLEFVERYGMDPNNINTFLKNNIGGQKT